MSWTAGANGKPGIYAITHTNSKRIYIGSGTSIGSRWRLHKSLLVRNVHHNAYLQNAWNKYGADAFSWSILELVTDKATLRQREQHWIDQTQSTNPRKGFNIAPKALGGFGRTISESHRARLREALKGNKHGKNEHYSGILTETDVMSILTSLANGDSYKDLATRFHVTSTNIGRIAKRRIWWNVVIPPDMEELLKQRKDNRKRGEKAGRAKLTDNDVVAIRTRRANGAKAAHLAVEYGVTPALISAICVRRIWKHIP